MMRTLLLKGFSEDGFRARSSRKETRELDDQKSCRL